jgi:uncharacterized protein (DUF433 family)
MAVIWTDPDRVSGAPCFQGTRVPVQNLVDSLEGGASIEEFLEDYPSVTRDQVSRFLAMDQEKEFLAKAQRTEEAQRGTDNGPQLDVAYIERTKKRLAGQEVPSLEEVRRILSVIPESMADLIIEEREER